MCFQFFKYFLVYLFHFCFSFSFFSCVWTENREGAEKTGGNNNNKNLWCELKPQSLRMRATTSTWVGGELLNVGNIFLCLITLWFFFIRIHNNTHVHIFTDFFSFAGSVHKSRDELLEFGVIYIYSTFPIENTGTYQRCQRGEWRKC